MSDNRRGLKWPAEERQNDPQANWNKLLVEHCLPSCYVKLFLKIVELEVNDSTDEDYMAWPDAEKLKNVKQWSGVLEPFFRELFQHEVVYPDISNGCWIRVKDAVFVPNNEDLPSIVETVLLQCKVNVTSVSQVVWSALNYYYKEPVKIVTPKLVRQILKENLQAYQSCESSKKLNLLRYCLNDDNFSEIIGLELLPLASGKFIHFSTQISEQKCYLCSTQVPKTLLPHSQNLLVDPCIDKILYRQLKKVVSSKCTQLRDLTVKVVALLLRSMPLGGFSGEWLDTFWSWVQPSYLFHFKNLSVVPVEHGKVAKLRKSAGVVFVPSYHEVTSHLATALAKYNVQLAIEENHSYFKFSQHLMNYLHKFDGPGVLDAISSVCSLPQESDLSSEEALALQEFFDDKQKFIQEDKLEVLRKLDIFYTLQNPHDLCHIDEVKESNSVTGKAIVEKGHFDFGHEFILPGPLVISRAKNQVRLLNVFGDTVVFKDKMVYLCQVLIPMISNGTYPVAKITPFMVSILKQFGTLTENYPLSMRKLTDLLSKLRFLQNLNNDWKCPTELYDPSSSDLMSLFKGRDVFPACPFNEKMFLAPLKRCGLRGPNSVTPQSIVNTIQRIGIPTKSAYQSCCEPCDIVSYERAQAVLKFLNRLEPKLSSTCIKQGNKLSFQDALAELRSGYSWLPVNSAQPSNYPSWLPWKGSLYEQHFATSCTVVVALDTDIEESEYPKIMGSEVMFINGVLHSTIAQILSSPQQNIVTAVLDHLDTLIAIKTNPSKKTSFMINSICSITYAFLDDALSLGKNNEESVSEDEESEDEESDDRSEENESEDELEEEIEDEEMAEIKKKIATYLNSPFIFTGRKFIRPSQVSLSRKFHGPYLYSPPSIIKGKMSLLKALGVKNNFEATDLFLALKSMYKANGSNILSEKCCEVVKGIMSILNECILPDHIDADVYLPDELYRLHRACDLSIREPWCSAGDNVFVSKRLKRSVAVAIGVQTVSNRFLQTYRSSQSPFYSMKFSNEEELTCRIKNILIKYPHDKENATLLKGLVQNADNAEATKMSIILDKRTHGHNSVLSEYWSDLQGPALLVWNNAEFTESDLNRIQQVGLGSIRDDSEFVGIGFNVVYQITDCPSLLIGGTTLSVFDPHSRYCPKTSASFPGGQFDNLDKAFWSTFSDLKSAYLREPLPGLPHELLGGSLFRFPLRRTQDLLDKSKLVDHDSTNLIDAHTIEACLHHWVTQMKEALLFLSNITDLSFYVISEDRSCHIYSYKVDIEETDSSKRKKFHRSTEQFHKTKTADLIMYQMSITGTNSSDESASEEEWLIQQGVGDIEENKQEWSFSDCIVPKHGLAALLSASKVTNFEGKAFCFLPFSIDSYLPVHVNGQFILNSDCRSLWTSNESDSKKSWNEKLLKAISSSYAHFLISARYHFVLKNKGASNKQLLTSLSKYYQIFPCWESQSRFALSHRIAQGHSEERTVLTAKRVLTGNLEGEWKLVGELVFNKLWAKNPEILGVVTLTSSKVKWCKLHDEDDPYSQAYFIPQDDESMQQLLTNIGMTVTNAPFHLQQHFELLKYNPPVCTSESVFQFFIKHHKMILPGNLPIPIANTPFETPDEMVKFTVYITKLTDDQKHREYHSSPYGYPLLLTADQCIATFDHQNKVISSRFSDLFANDLSRFLHPSMVKMQNKLSGNYFSSYEPFDIVISIFRRNFAELFDIDQVDNTDGCLISWKMLQRLWECLECNPIFRQHQRSIVQHFTIIPTTEQHLFSIKSFVLPLVPLDEDTKSSKCDICTFQLLASLGMPIFDASKLPLLAETVQPYCIQMSEQGRVLETLYHFHTETKSISPNDEISDALFEYFNHSFKEDDDSKMYITSLPIFKTANGRYTSICSKEAYAFPDGECCKAGYDKWIDTDTLVLLEANEKSKSVYEDLSIDQLSMTDVYTKYILKSFRKLTAHERMEHLEFIREKLSANKTLLTELETVACLKDPSSDSLLPLSHFSDPINCQTFSNIFKRFEASSKGVYCKKVASIL